MEKTILISGKEVRLKNTGSFALRYKEQFGKNPISEIMGMIEVFQDMDIESISPELDLADLKKIDFDIFYNVIWTMAKTADKSIASPLDWLDEFDEFPIIDILPEVMDMLIQSFTSTIQSKKNMNHPAMKR